MNTNAVPNPQALRLEDVARLLSSVWPRPVTVETLRADIEDGAPTNPDGTINLLEYTRWWLHEVLHARD